jgi:hypothetical protein
MQEAWHAYAASHFETLSWLCCVPGCEYRGDHDFAVLAACAVTFDGADRVPSVMAARLQQPRVPAWSLLMRSSFPKSSKAPNISRLLPSSKMMRSLRMNKLVTDDLRIRCASELVIGYGPPADDVLRYVGGVSCEQ